MYFDAVMNMVCMLHGLLCARSSSFFSKGLEGRGWPQEGPAYGRLPARAQAGLANATDCFYTFDLGQCSAGVLVRFATNAQEIEIKVNRRSIGDGE